jgi:phenylacetate-CoA ligase
MNKILSKYLFYFPTTLIRGELVGFFLPKYRRFQYLPPEDIRLYQRKRLYLLLDHATDNTKYYAQYRPDMPKFGRDGNEFFQWFLNIPTLQKVDLISSHEEIKARRQFFSSKKTTGGSTGEPVKVLKNPEALARERAATWRSYEWAGVSIGDKQARFWGVPHSQEDKFKARLIDFVSNRQRISAFDLSERSLNNYYQQLLKYKPIYLYGYVSVIEIFSRYIADNCLSPLPSLRSIITTSEVLSPNSRKVIETNFGVKVFNEYGCGEVGSIAHECEYGNMHIMADNLFVEINDNSGTGEIVVTDLFNFSMPLIRYNLGDYATIDKSSCQCGRNLPIIKGIHGRAYDVIKTSNNKILHPEAVMYIFETIQDKYNAFKHFQVIQDTATNFTINIVPTSQWSNEIEHLITLELRVHIADDIRTKFNLLDAIEREKSGKMRVVKSFTNNV